MNQQKQIKKIEELARKFKTRAHRSPNDRKRHDSTQSDEQKVMRDAYNKLGWSYAKIGGAFDRDPRTVARTVQQGVKSKDETIAQDDSSLPDENNLSTATSPQEKSDACQGSPDYLDVTVLRSQGVPKAKAAEILLDWRAFHREGNHSGCSFNAQLLVDLKHKIPFRVADAMLKSALKAEEYHYAEGLRDIQIARTYHMWENSENKKAAFKEMEEVSKPDPETAEAIKKHLEDIRQLLMDLDAQVKTALSNSDYEARFEIEKSSFLHHMGPTHSWEVVFDLWDYIHQRMTYEQFTHERRTRQKTEELQTQRKKVSGALKTLRGTLNQALANQTYRYGTCSECPRPTH